MAQCSTPKDMYLALCNRRASTESVIHATAGAQSVSAAQRKAERISQSSSLPGGGMADWKEGQLFPEGWEDMNAFKKVRCILRSLYCPLPHAWEPRLTRGDLRLKCPVPLLC